jgi:hypothetical protein
MRAISCVLLALCSCVETTVSIPERELTARCETSCGLFTNNLPEGECHALEQNERLIIGSYQGIAHVNVCPALKGWQVVLVDGENGQFQVQREWVAGMTSCQGVTFIGGDPSRTGSGFAHEVGHIYECVQSRPSPSINKKHVGWKAKGFCAAIREASMIDISCEE